MLGRMLLKNKKNLLKNKRLQVKVVLGAGLEPAQALLPTGF